MTWGAKLSGGDDLARRLEAMKALSGQEVGTRALTAGAEPIAEAARANVRTRTGDLRDSIKVGPILSPAQATQAPNDGTAQVYVGPGPLPEAITEEFGTAHEAPHPFMRPAWDENRDIAFQKVADVYTDECAKIAEG